MLTVFTLRRHNDEDHLCIPSGSPCGRHTFPVVVAQDAAPAGAYKLQILHTSDMESDFQDSNTLEDKVNHYSALVEGLRKIAEKEGAGSVHVTAGDNTLPGPFYQAAAEADSLGYPGAGDVSIFNALGFDALGLGNHGFDNGADDFCKVASNLAMPLLAANLDFSAFECAEGISIAEDALDCSTIGGSVAKSCHVTLDDGLVVGFIGRAPAGFFEVVEDPAETLPGLDFMGGRDPETNQPLESAIPMVLEQVDALTAAGAKAILLLDHAQDWTTDPLDALELRGVDVIVQAGATNFMAGNESTDGVFNTLREGDETTGMYPTESTDSEGNTVLIINTEQLWRYIGMLLVDFDENGNVIGYDARSGPIATTEYVVASLGDLIGSELDPILEVANTLQTLKDTDSISEAYESIGTTEFGLNGLRADVRSRETNLGRLAADSTIWAADRFLADNGLDDKCDIALKNGGGIRATIEGPEVTRIAVQKALAFDNSLAVVKLTVPQLIAVFENAVSRYPSLDGRFPQIAGMTLGYADSTEGIESATTLDEPSRIVDMTIGDDAIIKGGAVVADMDDTYVLATNSFLVTGGDGYTALTEAESLGETDIGEQQILEEYIVDALDATVSIEDPPSDARVYVWTEEPAPFEPADDASDVIVCASSSSSS